MDIPSPKKVPALTEEVRRHAPLPAWCSMQRSPTGTTRRTPFQTFRSGLRKSTHARVFQPVTDERSLEQNLGIIAASLPTLRVFFKELGRAIATSSRSLLTAFSTRSPASSSDDSGSTKRESDVEKGMAQWSDSESGMSGKDSNQEVHAFDEKELDLKYLGGSLDL